MTWAWIVAALACVPLALTCLNVVSWRRPRPRTRSKIGVGRVSVLIPARNEAARIELTLRGAATCSPAIGEILVYDDQSTDDTATIVARSSREFDRIRLISGVPLPAGWVGKPHACHQLASHAHGTHLLFLDADVRLEPGAVDGMLELLDESVGGRVVTAVPRQLNETFVERLVLPLLVLTYTSWLPLRAIEWGRSASTVAANGQMLLVARTDYEALGGFASVRSEIVDDVAFCRLAKTRGYRVIFADGTRLASCRMYDSARAVWRGFSKNLYEGLGASPLGLLSALVLYCACFIAPYLVLVLGLAGASTAIGPGLVGVGAQVLLRSILALRYGQPPEGILLHPFGVLVLCAIALNSALWYRRGEIVWAERSYGQRAGRRAVEHVWASEESRP